MPAIVSHYLLAERVYGTLSPYCAALNDQRTAFLWGASGPDIFFTHRLLPWQTGKSLRSFGSKMHNMPAEKIINYFMSYANNSHSDAAVAYTLGFVTHYAFDSTAHPFVLYFAEKMAEKQPFKNISMCHNEIESALDTMFLKREKNERISNFKLQSTSPFQKEVNLTIAELYHSYFLMSMHKNVSVDTLIEVQRDWNKGLSLLNDSHKLKKSVVQTGEKLFRSEAALSSIIRTPLPDVKKDYANLKKSEWIAPADGSEHHDTFFELADKATKLSLQLSAILIAGNPLPHTLCEASFSGKKKNC